MSHESNIVMAVSGAGRSLRNVIEQQARFRSYRLVGVVASSECGALEIAREFDLPILVEKFSDHMDTKHLENWLKTHNADWIVLAGFLKKWPELLPFRERVINIHPALLPSYGGQGMYGMRVHEAVASSKEPETGATVHFVNERYDEGAIIAQATVKIPAHRVPGDIAAEVFRAECQLLPETIHQLSRAMNSEAQVGIGRFKLSSSGALVPSLKTLQNALGLEWAYFVSHFYGGLDPIAPVIRYVLEGEGKKTRAQLTALFCAASGGFWRKALPAAFAIEMVHAYSLVHDDLPAMDNDDMRRGRPTAHKKFNEASAILAGDGLLTDAFSVLSRTYDAAAGAMCGVLADAAGSRGMVLGQALDMAATGYADVGDSPLEIHSHKTGDLMGAAAALGVLAAGGAKDLVNHAHAIGRQIGVAFQVLDDLLDDSAQSGKSIGKDARDGKLTAVSALGRDAAKALAEELTTKAVNGVKTYFEDTDALVELIHSLLARNS